jgi:hypothetical protein
VLGWQAEGSWALRATMPALLLTAGCVWLLNGLHSAPDNGPASRNLMDCILPEVDRVGADEIFLAYGKAIDADDDDDDGYMSDDYDIRMTLPGNPHGLVFLRDLRIGQRHPVPRMSSGKALSDRSFRFFFGIDLEDIGENFFSSNPVRRSGPAAVRSNNRARRTLRYIPPEDAPQQNLFHLRVRGVELQPSQDEGSDLEDEDEEGREGDIDRRLTTLWLQFIQDVTQKVPNRKGSRAGYCNLLAEEREGGNEALYKDLRLSRFFNDCQWRVGSDDDWNTAFNHLFPLGDKPASAQNYRQTIYFGMWQKMKEDAEDQQTLETIRKALKSKFGTLLWFPSAEAGRIWVTRLHAGYKKFVNVGQPAPWVLCRREPIWN